jgi:RNA polymerase sigma-70 factor (ECF subfamily)
VIKEGQLESKQPLVPLVYANHISQNHENPTQVVERRLENEWLWQGLDKIDENQREIIILRFVVGLSLKETAGTLDRTVAAVKTLQHRGILALQAALAYE